MKELQNYNIAKAIREASENKLTGLELEMHREAELTEITPTYGNLRIPSIILNQRANEMTMVTGATYGHYPKSVYNKPTPKIAEYDRFGVTVLRDLTNEIDVPFTERSNFAKLTEGQAVPQVTGYSGKGTLKPYRFSGYQTYTNEYLKETDAVELILADAIYQIDRVITSDLIGKALLNQFTVEEAVTATGYDTMINKISYLQGVIKPAFVTSMENYQAALAYERISGSGFMIEPKEFNYGKLKGVDVFATDLITEDDTATIIFADWSKAYVGLFGGLQVIINPYVGSDNGFTKLTFTRFADTAINNLTTISVTQDISTP